MLLCYVVVSVRTHYYREESGDKHHQIHHKREVRRLKGSTPSSRGKKHDPSEEINVKIKNHDIIDVVIDEDSLIAP